MVEITTGTQVESQKPAGTGGFLNPEKIISQFGLASDLKVADFGSGSGHFAILIAQFLGDTGTVTAIDILESALETVRIKASTLGLTNIQTVRGNLEVIGASGLSESSQDLVLAANVFFQNEKKQELIGEAKRVLKSGGKLIVIDWQKGSGGVGPPDNLRLGKELITPLASQLGFEFEKEIDAGSYHFGLIFKKT